MDVAGVVTIVISAVALALGVLNFWRARADRSLENEVEAQKLIDLAYGMLAPKPGSNFFPADLIRRPDARALIERAAMLAPSSTTVIRWQGIEHEADGNKERAKECFERLAQSEEGRWRGYMDLGQLHDGEQSIRYFERAAEFNPGRSAEPLVAIARAHEKDGRIDPAIEYTRRSLEANPQFAPAHTLMGRLLQGKGKSSEAKEHYERAIELDSTNVEPMVFLGALLASDQASWHEGREWIECGMRIDPNDDLPHVMLAAIHADREEPEESLVHYERATELKPTRKLHSDSAFETAAVMRQLLETRRASTSQANPPDEV